MRNWKIKAASLVALAAILPLLMAPTGGFPSRPTFQTVTTLSTATFGGLVTANNSGGTLARFQTNSTAGCNGFFGQNNGAQTTYLAVNVAAGSCTTGASIGDVTLDHAATLRFSHAGTQHATLTTTGLFNVANDLQINGVSACRGDGTNCQVTSANSQARITCTTACNVSTLPIGGTATIVKTAATNRASVTTFVADADLQFTNVPVGRYSLQLLSDFSGTGAGGSHWTYTGASSAANGDTTQDCAGTLTMLNIGIGSAQLCASAGVTYWRSQVALNQTVSATVSFDWGQNSSNVANTVLAAGSYMILTRLN